MGFFTKDIKTMDDLFVHTLRDICYAEKQIEKPPTTKWRNPGVDESTGGQSPRQAPPLADNQFGAVAGGRIGSGVTRKD
jgi:hypothetical protein